MGTPRACRKVGLSLAVLGLLPLVGCQVEYAGMTLPSGKYMHDDIQYFEPGPHFPWANTQAATQRARMASMGIEPEPVAAPGASPFVGGQGMTPLPVSPPAPAGALDPTQNQMGQPTNVNTQPLPPEPGEVPAPPSGEVPMP